MDEGLPGTGRFPHYSLVLHSILLRFLLFYGPLFVGFCFSRETHDGFPAASFLTLKSLSCVDSGSSAGTYRGLAEVWGMRKLYALVVLWPMGAVQFGLLPKMIEQGL